MLHYLLPFLLVSSMLSVKAAHIVGGELYYTCLGNDRYRITLKVYRDCNSFGPNVADFDFPAYLSIFDGSGAFLDTIEVYDFLRTPVTLPPTDPCLTAPPNICVEEAIYEFEDDFPPVAGGYEIVYQRCCRNGTIFNILSPGSQGTTFSVKIPGTGSVNCNSSPQFQDFPPIVICAGEPLSFDHSAIDPDGDQLSYSFCTPFSGADEIFPYPSVSSSPPFPLIQWASGFSANNPITSSPPVTINPVTGIITGEPTQIGQFVVGVCVTETRNGVVIGTLRRDFQFNVALCESSADIRIPVIDTNNVLAAGTVGIFDDRCLSFTHTFSASTFNVFDYSWDFGVPGISSDTSDLSSPTYTYPDTGVYVINVVVNEGTRCEDSTSVTIVIYPGFDADFTYLDACGQTGVSFFDSSFTQYGVINRFEWQFVNNDTSQARNVEYAFPGPGFYTVSHAAFSDKGCRDVEVKQVEVRDAPIADFQLSSACEGQPVYFLDFSTVGTGVIDQWNWERDGLTVSTSPNPIFVYDERGLVTITLEVSTTQGCTDTLTRSFYVRETPFSDAGVDTFLIRDEFVFLNGTASAQTTGWSYYWTPGAGLSDSLVLNPRAEPFNTTDYILAVSTDEGCISTDTMTLQVIALDAIIVPNAISPNGDGVNDFFRILGTRNIETIESIQVFNRWGEAVFDSDFREALWDGMYNGKEVPLGVYTYLIRAINRDGKAVNVSGDLTVVR